MEPLPPARKRLPRWLRITGYVLLGLVVLAVGAGLLLRWYFSTGDLDSGGPLRPRQAAYDVRRYDLAVAVDPVAKAIRGTNRATVVAIAALDRFEIQLDDRMVVAAAMDRRRPGRVRARRRVGDGPARDALGSRRTPRGDPPVRRRSEGRPPAAVERRLRLEADRRWTTVGRRHRAGRRRRRLVAVQGPSLGRTRRGDVDRPDRSRRSGRSHQRQAAFRGEERRRHDHQPLGSDLSDQQLSGVGEHRALRSDRSDLQRDRRHAGREDPLLGASRARGEGAGDVEAGAEDARGSGPALRRIPVPARQVLGRRDALPRHGAPDDRRLRRRLRGQQVRLRLAAPPRNGARVVGQQDHRRRLGRLLDPRGLRYLRRGDLRQRHPGGREVPRVHAPAAQAPRQSASRSCRGAT